MSISRSSSRKDDPYNLERFVAAQEPVFGDVIAELRDGRKHTHWMWFIFPQIEGLGYSAIARKFAIASLAEARAYLGHLTLGPRLIECTHLVNQVEGRTAHQIFGSPDDMKFRSSMTLFAKAATDPGLFNNALARYFGGVADPATLDRL